MKKKIICRLAAIILAAAAALSCAGCGGRAARQSDDSLQRVLDAGQLVLGLDTEFPPMGFIDEAGEIVGFDIDVAREVCGRLGIGLETRGIDWDCKEDELNSGRIDCIWNGFSSTPARAEAMCLSDAYMKNELIFVVPGSSSVKSMRDLAGKTVGVQSGSTAQDVLEASDFYEDISPVLFDTEKELLQKLKAQETDVAFVDSVAAFYFIFSDDDPFFILPDSIGEEEYVIGFRKDDVKLRDRIQEIIGSMKADGTLGTISKKWFGSDITTVR